MKIYEISNRDKLIEFISKQDHTTRSQYNKGGKWLLIFLEEYHLIGLWQATEAQLNEFIKNKNFNNQTR